tara:strand:+ start:450 stop:629 length:180 start_codon:yes stop_codon:yes gene_type:complete
MNGLRIHNVNNIKVKQDSSFDTFATITVTVTDKDNKDFELQLFTEKGFTPNLEVEDGDA